MVRTCDKATLSMINIWQTQQGWPFLTGLYIFIISSGFFFSLIYYCPSWEFQFPQQLYIRSFRWTSHLVWFHWLELQLPNAWHVCKDQTIPNLQAYKCLICLYRPQFSCPYNSSVFKISVFLLPPFSLFCYEFMTSFLPICISGNMQWLTKS